MEPLLQITNIPITYELKVNNAQLDYVNGKADVEIKNFHNGGFKIKTQPAKLNIDTFECFNSMCPTNTRSIKMAAERGKATAYKATATYAQEGKLLLDAKLGEDVLGQIAASKSHVSTDIGITFKPSVPPEISWSKPELTMEYEVDKLNFEWKLSNGKFEFIPGNIEVFIKQHPEVVIEYIGDPIYAPPSADPNYKPTDVWA